MLTFLQVLTQTFLRNAKGLKWLYALSSKANTSQYVAAYNDMCWKIKKQRILILKIENIILKPKYVATSSILKKIAVFCLF